MARHLIQLRPDSNVQEEVARLRKVCQKRGLSEQDTTLLVHSAESAMESMLFQARSLSEVSAHINASKGITQGHLAVRIELSTLPEPLWRRMLRRVGLA